MPPCGVYPTPPKYLSNKLKIWSDLATTNRAAGAKNEGGGQEGEPHIGVQSGSVERRDHLKRLALQCQRPHKDPVRS